MVHVNFDPDTVDWDSFFRNQHGSGYYFEGTPYQRGYGIGAIFGPLFRFLLPIGKIIGQELGREGLAMGSRIIGDLSSGNTLKDSLRNQTKEGIKNFVDNVYERDQTGKGRILSSTIGGIKPKRRQHSIIGKRWTKPRWE